MEELGKLPDMRANKVGFTRSIGENEASEVESTMVAWTPDPDCCTIRVTEPLNGKSWLIRP